MSHAPEANFAARLFSRLSDTSDLIDAASGEIIAADDVPRRIGGFAAGFAAAGLVPGDRIIISCKLTPATTLAYLGALYAGLTVVPVDERALSTASEIIVDKTSARAVWTNEGPHGTWANGRSVLHLEGSPEIQDTSAVAPAPRREDDLAALMPTSGSTGAPKFVKVSHGNLIANTEAIIRSQRLERAERALLILPLCYCFGASVVHSHLYQGGGVVHDSRFMFPDKVLHAIGTHGCTTFAGVPTVYNILLRRSNIASIPLTSLRRFLQAGGALPAERVEQMCALVPHAEFFVMYGQTEATSRISCLPPERLKEKLGSVGLPLDNLRVRIVDEEERELPTGHSGEIWVSGKSICAGYLDEPEATAQKFRGEWLATGDIGSCDADGYLWILGRKGEFIKMRGIRVSFAEIEARVAAMPGISECAAVAVGHCEAGEAVALYVVVEPGAQNVIASIRRNLPPEWVCDSVTIVAELPRNLNGKLVRSGLSSGVAAEMGETAPATRRGRLA